MEAPEEKPARKLRPTITPRFITQLIMLLALAAVLIYVLTERSAPRGIPEKAAESEPSSELAAPAGPTRGLSSTAVQAPSEVLTGPSIFPDSALLEWKREKNFRYQPASTPAAAYATLMAAFIMEGAPRDIPFDKKQKSQRYEILQDDRRAVVYFGENRGIEFQPYLLARTREGWIFDYISQVRLVLYGPGQLWKVAFGDDEYQALFDQRRFPSSSETLDIPWMTEDVYYPENDRKMVQRILDLEGTLAKRPEDFAGALEVARLGIIVNRPPSAVIPWLNKAKALKPESAQPYLYAALAHLVRVNEPRKAVAELNEALQRDPRSLFGRRLLAYLHYVLKEHEMAILQFRDLLSQVPGDCYASTYLGRALLGRYKLKRSPEDRQAALEVLGTVLLKGCGPKSRRAASLWSDLKQNRLIEQARFGLSHVPLSSGGRLSVLVTQIEEGSAAAKAGLEVGDYIVAFDQRPVRTSFELQYLFAIAEPGREVSLGIVRGALQEPVTLGDGTEVVPNTQGLDPPRELTLVVVPDRRKPTE